MSEIGYFGGKASNFGILRGSIPNNSPVALTFSFDLWEEFLDQTLAGGNTLREEIDDLLSGKAYIDHSHPRDQWVNEEFVLTASNITAKEVTLANMPLDINALTFKIIGGIEQYEGIDFSITDSTVSWAGHALDGILAEGDQIRINYQIIG